MLWADHQRALAQIQALILELTDAKNLIKELIGANGRKRQTYKNVERDPETGRLIGVCFSCGRKTVLPARRLCRKCYNAWHYRNHPRRQRLGSKPLTSAELRWIKNLV